MHKSWNKGGPMNRKTKAMALGCLTLIFLFLSSGQDITPCP